MKSTMVYIIYKYMIKISPKGVLKLQQKVGIG